MRVDPRHARAARPLAEPTDERVDGLRRAGRLDLYRPVEKIPHPTADAEAPRLVSGGGAKPDPLHPPPHHRSHTLQGWILSSGAGRTAAGISPAAAATASTGRADPAGAGRPSMAAAKM